MGSAAEVAAWCEAVPLLLRLAAAQGRTTEAEELVRDLRDGADAIGRLAELGRQLGVPSIGARAVTGVPGVSPGVPVDGLYVCPGGRCTRDWVRAPGVPTPECHVFGVPLEPARPLRHPR
ncbi:hypothetical protein ACIREE_00645 [Streptomyces sp. NPDC102467]|uniref:hypothetical protein n=1 Tax=Streptomyces sp. NPDC102467 TaxID=3366179 RepID=UPI00382F5513